MLGGWARPLRKQNPCRKREAVKREIDLKNNNERNVMQILESSSLKEGKMFLDGGRSSYWAEIKDQQQWSVHLR